MFIVMFWALLDILADAFPEVSTVNDMFQYFPSALAGFLCFASMTGSMDSSLFHLVISGVLVGHSKGVRYVRNLSVSLRIFPNKLV